MLLNFFLLRQAEVSDKKIENLKCQIKILQQSMALQIKTRFFWSTDWEKLFFMICRKLVQPEFT